MALEEPISGSVGFDGRSNTGLIGRILPNLAVLGARLRRRRCPSADACCYPYTRLVKAMAVLFALQAAVALVGFDPHAPGWAKAMGPPAREAFRGITDLGKSHWLLIPSGLLGLGLLVADWRRVRRRIAAAWVEMGELAGFFFFAVAGAGLTTNLIKCLVGRARPVRFKEDGFLAFEPLSFGYANVSFPSGHATTIAAAATAVALIFRNRPGLVAAVAVFAAFVAFSRVAAGAHHPSDVAAGVFVGIAFTVIYAYALGRSGVAFQRLASGALMPKTVVLRGTTGPDGRRAMLAGLRDAWFARRPVLHAGPERDHPAAARPKLASRSAIRSAGSSSPM